MNNYEIELFKNKIIDTTNESGLNIGIIYFVFKDLYKQIEDLYNQQLQRDYVEYQNKEQEKEKEQSEIKEE